MLVLVIYLSFIGLGLPDSCLGAAWPEMYSFFGAEVSTGGFISMTVCVGTIFSALLSGTLRARFSEGVITGVSILMTAVAMFAMSFQSEVWAMFLLAVPLGLGAGSVDSALNNYVAIHFNSRTMSWLHCCWGVGTITSSALISRFFAMGYSWQMAYRTVGTALLAISLVVFLSLPLWKKTPLSPKFNGSDTGAEKGATTPLQAIKIPGVWKAGLSFFCYCSFETAFSLWLPTFGIAVHGLSSSEAALLSTAFFFGIMGGRFLTGVIGDGIKPSNLVAFGFAAVVLFSFSLFIPGLSRIHLMILAALIGLGCAPCYPMMIRLTPDRFGILNNGAVIGFQMAFAYVGSSFSPTLIGRASTAIGWSFYPVFPIALAALGLILTISLRRRQVV